MSACLTPKEVRPMVADETVRVVYCRLCTSLQPDIFTQLRYKRLSLPQLAILRRRTRQTRMRFQHSISSGIPSCSAAQYGTSVVCQLQPPKCTHFPSTLPPSHTSPPRRSAPTGAARSRQTGIWFQHRIDSGMPSCSATQYGTSVGCQIQPQKCTHFSERDFFEREVGLFF